MSLAPVIVTRPAPAGPRLCESLQARGRQAWWWPAFEIAPLAEPQAVAARLARLSQDELVLVVSPAAVAALAGLLPCWPAGVRLAAVGEGTAQALFATFGAGIDLVRPADDASESGSEALWDELQKRELPQRVLIARAEHGREWLGARLEAAGVAVERLAVYRRLPGALDRAQGAQLAQALSGPPPEILVTSSEGVDVLLAELATQPGALEWARRGRVLAIHSRIIERLVAAGFDQTCLVAADDETVVATLESLASGNRDEADGAPLAASHSNESR